jgi:hypothetical protein
MLLAAWSAIALAGTPPEIPDRAPDQTFTVEIADGKVWDNAWAWQSTVACFASAMSPSYNGPQQLLVLEQKAGTDLIIRAKPAGGADVSLYAIQNGATSRGQRPPTISSAWRCSTSWLAPAGQPELFKLGSGNGALEVVLGIVGSKGTAAGSVTIDVWETPGRTFKPE